MAALPALVAVVVAALACGGCHPVPPTPPIDAGIVGDASPRPLAILGDRVSDVLEMVEVAPSFQQAARLSVDENPTFIDEPFDLALGPDKDTLYVVLGHADGYQMGTLRKLRLSDGKVLGEVVLGQEPSMIALSSTGERAYISLFRNLAHPMGPWTDPGALLVVDTVAMRVLGQVEVCGAALGVALDEADARVWVACLGTDEVALVDVHGDAPTLQQKFALDDGSGSPGSGPSYVVLDGAHAYITAAGSGDLWVYDLATATFDRRVLFGSDAFPQRMALMPDGRLLLVCVDSAEQISAIATDALIAVDEVPTPGMHPQGIAVTADGRYAVFSDENDLVHPGRAVRVDLSGLGQGGAHVDGELPVAVFPQAVIITR